MKARLVPYFARAREEIESVGGIVEKFIGDAVVGFFGAPTSREDDAVRAVQAAWQVARAIDELNEQDAVARALDPDRRRHRRGGRRRRLRRRSAARPSRPAT